MQASEVRSMDDHGIADAIRSARQELFNLRFQKARGQLADPSQLRLARRELARCLTVQRERALWAEYRAAVEKEA